MDAYTIHAGAPLQPEWAEWFAGAEIRTRPDGTGILVASVSDQAMLFGLLLRLRDLRIPLLGVYPGAAAAGRVNDRAEAVAIHETDANQQRGS